VAILMTKSLTRAAVGADADMLYLDESIG